MGPRAGGAEGRTDPPRLRASITTVTATRYLSLAVSMVVGVVLARSLDVPSRGELAVALALSGIAAALLTAGLDTATLWATRPADRAAALAISRRRTLATSVVALGTAIPLALAEGHIVPGAEPTTLAVAVGIIPLLVGNQLFGNCAIAAGLVRQWSIASLANLLTYGLSVVALAATQRGSAPLYVLALGLGHSVQAALLRSAHGATVSEHNRAEIVQVKAVARGSSATSMLQLAMLRVPTPLISALAGAAAAGELAVALPFVEALLVLPVAAGAVLLPTYGRATFSRQAVLRHAGGVAALTAAVSALLLVAAPTAVPWIYGADYAEAARLIQVMAPAAILFTFARVLQSALQAGSRFAIVTGATAAGVATLLVVEVALAGTLKSLAAAIGLAAGLVVTAAVLSVGFMRGGQTRPGLAGPGS